MLNENHVMTNEKTSLSNKEQDKFLPIANVGRIMKKVIPGNGKISKDAKETLQECVSEFISFITGEASDKCQREKRKTINGDDIMWAVTTLGFEDYVSPLKMYLNKYREVEGEKVNVPKQHRIQQTMFHNNHQENNEITSGQFDSGTSVVYSSSTSFLPHQYGDFGGVDQAFSLPFSPTSMQTQLQQHERIDSLGHW